MTLSELEQAVFDAWAPVRAPAAKDMKNLERGGGDFSAREFVGVAPVDVDTDSAGFDAATPLFDLPPRAAAAYLGTFLLSLLRSLEYQQTLGLYDDIVTRAHTLTCLTSPEFWSDVIRAQLPPRCRQAVIAVARHFAAQPDALPLNGEQVDILRQMIREAED